jgi:hypothetical protein
MNPYKSVLEALQCPWIETNKDRSELDMMNRINLQLVAMGHEVTWGRVLILALNFVTFISLILGTSASLYAALLFASMILFSGHFIVFDTTKQARGLQELDLWLIGLTLAAGYLKLVFGI